MTGPSGQAGLLDGVTVLDFTRVLAGPYCTRLLGDLGARIIKIERPGEGDEMRKSHLQLDESRADQSTYFVRLNAGKWGVGIDLTHREARAVVLDLIDHADVVVENFLPGVMAKLGYDHATLRAVKPPLVYCSISGYGQTGPWSQRPAFAHIVHAVSGLMHLERAPGADPRVSYLQTADVLAGTLAFGAIVAALLRRERTGIGGFVDVSMLQALVAAEDLTYGSVLNGGDEVSGPRPGMMVHGIGGRYLALQIVGAADLWPRLVNALECPELETDPRFATPQARRAHWVELQPIIADLLTRFPTVDAALETLTAARVPCAPVLSPTETVALAQLEARAAFPCVPHPTRGAVRVTATPFHLDGHAVAPRGGAPYRVGEDTRTVLRDVLGYDAGRIEKLSTLGVIEEP